MADSVVTAAAATTSSGVALPRVAIEFCVQCKWNLRAAYYCQELLQTFSLSLGEIALIPSTSGKFVVSISLRDSQPAPPPAATSSTPPVTASTDPENSEQETGVKERTASKEATPLSLPSFPTIDSGGDGDGGGVKRYILWDRKIDGGFPETKELKRRVRDLVEPGRGLGHVDVDYRSSSSTTTTATTATKKERVGGDGGPGNGGTAGNRSFVTQGDGSGKVGVGRTAEEEVREEEECADCG